MAAADSRFSITGLRHWMASRPERRSCHDSLDLSITTIGLLDAAAETGDDPLGRDGKVILCGDGENISHPSEKASPDTDADLTFNVGKQSVMDGVGPNPQINLNFRRSAEPDLGIFKSPVWRLRPGAWNVAADVTGRLEGDRRPPPRPLGLERVEYTAKNGPPAGQLMSYLQSTVAMNGALVQELDSETL